MTDEKKTPQAGEYWVNSKGSIAYIVGVKLSGSVAYEDSSAWSYVVSVGDWSDWHHEPRCTGFDWVEPAAETWPQYWTTISYGDERIAYVRRISKYEFVCVYKDGTDGPHIGKWSMEESRKRLTADEAAALLTPQSMRQPVRLFRKFFTGEVIAVIDSDGDPIDLSAEAQEIQHDENGWYVEGVQ